VFERRPGAPLWRHAEVLNKTYTGKPALELVVRTIPTVGNYDYVLDWVFTPVGEIRVEVGATGFVAVKGVAAERRAGSPDEAGTSHGALVAPHLVAVDHDHFLSFRFDLDIDGPTNTFVRERLVTQELAQENRRRSVWALQRVPFQREAGVSAHGPEVWRIVNPSVETSLGTSPGYQILAGHSATSLLKAHDWPQRRAAFSAEQLWLTAYNPDQLYAAGRYPNQSRGGDGLPAFVDGQSLEGADLVAWYTMGFHHVTRPEDWPIVPTVWHSVTLRPFGFFAQNPAVEPPRSAAGASGTETLRPADPKP
jgi:primary-amine oxidase